jgi:glycosyltransferase involved in cell wall biosynthesis
MSVAEVLVSEPGVVAALAAGLKRASGDVVAFTDDDAEPRPDWLERIAAHFAADSEIGAVGGRDLLPGFDEHVDGDGPDVGRVRWWGRTVGNHHLGGRVQLVHYLKGVNMACRRAPLLSIDTALRGKGAQVAWDMDSSLAFTRAAWRVVYDPTIVVDHFPAERFDEDRRGRPTPGAIRDAAHNEMYVLLKRLAFWQKPIALVYGLAVGNRGAPGLALFVERIVREERRGDVLARSAAGLLGRLLAIATLVRMRTAARRSSSPPPEVIASAAVSSWPEHSSLMSTATESTQQSSFSSQEASRQRWRNSKRSRS